MMGRMNLAVDPARSDPQRRRGECHRQPLALARKGARSTCRRSRWATPVLQAAPVAHHVMKPDGTTVTRPGAVSIGGLTGRPGPVRCARTTGGGNAQRRHGDRGAAAPERLGRYHLTNDPTDHGSRAAGPSTSFGEAGLAVAPTPAPSGDHPRSIQQPAGDGRLPADLERWW